MTRATRRPRRVSIAVRGAVQGVGFRPEVRRRADALGLSGFVRNAPGGAEIEIEGPGDAIESMIAALSAFDAPARIDEALPREVAPLGDRGFTIRESRRGADTTFPLLPDLATCDACMAEVLDRESRRYRHPFASCARCGPRWSISTGLPWDRARTVMAGFAPCAQCRAEYDDPCDPRRHHAQTLACPRCGPRLTLRAPDGRVDARDEQALEHAAQSLRAGGIVALRGLGGFQLLVDAANDAAVRRLRKRKRRPHKPFALVVADLEAARALVEMSPLERDAFGSPAGPIVLARRHPGAQVADAVAPHVAWLGVMRATTPLHRLLIDASGAALVATSGNPSGEPLCTNDTEALARLGDVADVFLTHDREIVRPVDDSVVREIGGRMVTLRCARGLAPLAIAQSDSGERPLAFAQSDFGEPRLALEQSDSGEPRLALGGDLKAAVALASGGCVLLGPHVGDVESVRARDAVFRSADGLCQMTGAEPAAVRTDAHPDARLRDVARDAAARCAARSEVVFHHHAHVLAGCAEHDAPLPVLGIACDGAGFGIDRTTWGGEVVRADERGVERLAHLRRFRLPGGDAAAREPSRAALGLLFARFGHEAFGRSDPTHTAFEGDEIRALARVLDSGRFAPETSSTGRLFDAVASLLDVRQRSSYEGQAALELESLALDCADEQRYPMTCHGGVIDWLPLLDALLADRDAGVSVPVIAARFHRGLAGGLADAALQAARETGLARVVLTGGCFQNALLSSFTEAVLERGGLDVIVHERVPPNDGGLAVGQLLATGCAPAEGGL